MSINVHYPVWILILLLSLALGTASALPAEGLPGLAALLLHSAVIFLSLAVFFLVLPRFMGQPMQIFTAMILGIAVAWVLTLLGWEELMTDYLGIFGELFILLLTMVIIPLVFFSIVCGIAGIGDVGRLGVFGVKTLAYYVTTTAIAVAIGLVVVNAIRPGVGQETLAVSVSAEQETATSDAPSPDSDLTPGQLIQEEVLPVFTVSPVRAMAEGTILAVIFFALLLGAALAANGERAEPALAFFRSMDGAMITLVMWIMRLAPIGVFALMGRAVATLGLSYILLLAKYCFTVVLGLSVHFIVLVFVIGLVVGRVSPFRFLRAMGPALGLAFSTSSSSATLPVTIDCASRRLGLGRHVCSFVLPLGATINMDGTALYQAVASLFIAQVYGMDLTIAQQLMVFLTAIMVSVGAAGIPGASVGMMTIVLASAGIPVEGVAIVIGVDRVLDMCRTLVNVSGDSVGTVVIARTEGAVGEPRPAAATLGS